MVMKLLVFESVGNRDEDEGSRDENEDGCSDVEVFLELSR
jgi:hypothetical protein